VVENATGRVAVVAVLGGRPDEAGTVGAADPFGRHKEMDKVEACVVGIVVVVVEHEGLAHMSKGGAETSMMALVLELPLKEWRVEERMDKHNILLGQQIVVVGLGASATGIW
jgi:hypothetical protein